MASWFKIKSLHNDLVITVDPQTLDVTVDEDNSPLFLCDSQLFKWTDDGHIVCKFNGRVLDVDGSNVEKGARVLLWQKLPGKRKNQLWQKKSSGHITSNLNGFCIDIYDDDKGAGSSLITWPLREHLWQKWAFVEESSKVAQQTLKTDGLNSNSLDEEVEVISMDEVEGKESPVKKDFSSMYSIISDHNGLALTVCEESGEVCVSDKESPLPLSQKWQLTVEGCVVNLFNGKVLDIDPNTMDIILKAKLETGGTDEVLRQQWSHSVSGHLVSKANACCMDIHDSDKGPGSSLVLWAQTQHPWQKWTFVPTPDTAQLEAHQSVIATEDNIPANEKIEENMAVNAEKQAKSVKESKAPTVKHKEPEQQEEGTLGGMNGEQCSKTSSPHAQKRNNTVMEDHTEKSEDSVKQTLNKKKTCTSAVAIKKTDTKEAEVVVGQKQHQQSDFPTASACGIYVPKYDPHKMMS